MIRLRRLNLSSPRNYLPLIFCALALALPLYVQNIYLQHVVIMALMYAALGGAWNIISGYGGQFSLGHVAFLGLGAYTSTLLYIHLGVTPWIGMWLAGLVAMASSLVISYPTFRLRGPFFTLAGVAFVNVLYLLFIMFPDLHPITGGAVGLIISFQGENLLNFQFYGKVSYYYIILAIFIGTLLVTKLIERSKLGYELKSIRDDQDAAETLGVNSSRVKLKAMLISAFLTGMIGTFYAQYFLFIAPSILFDLYLNIKIVSIGILGGVGTLLGPGIGAFILVPVDLYTNVWLGGAYGGVSLMLYGAFLVIGVRFFPFGIEGIFTRGYEKLVLWLKGGKHHAAQG